VPLSASAGASESTRLVAMISQPSQIQHFSYILK
jgi:hypothetical protein